VKRRAVILAAIFLGWWLLAAAPAPLGSIFSPQQVHAEEGWEAEFRAVCGRTDDAMTFSASELRGLIDRCDLLNARIGQLSEPQRKVFAKRLQMCRDLYVFTLEAKEKK
jgi:hypothetical protein